MKIPLLQRGIAICDASRVSQQRFDKALANRGNENASNQSFVPWCPLHRATSWAFRRTRMYPGCIWLHILKIICDSHTFPHCIMRVPTAIFRFTCVSFLWGDYNGVTLWRALVGQSLGRQTLVDARAITCLAGRWRIDTHTHTRTHIPSISIRYRLIILLELTCSAPMQARGGNYHRLSVAWLQRKDLFLPGVLMQNTVMIWWLLDVLGNSTTLRAGAWKRPENCRVWWWQWQALGIIGLVCLGIALTCHGRALCCRKVKALGVYYLCILVSS